MRAVYRFAVLLLVAVFTLAVTDSPFHPVNRAFLLRERYETLMFFNSTCALSGKGLDEGAVLFVDLKVPLAFGGDTSFFNRWVLSEEKVREKNAFFTNLTTNAWRYVFSGMDAKTRFYRYAEISKGLPTPDYIMEIVARTNWYNWNYYTTTLRLTGEIFFAYTNKTYHCFALVSNVRYQDTSRDTPVRKTDASMERLKNPKHTRDEVSSRVKAYIRKRDGNRCQRCGRRVGDVVGYRTDGSARRTQIQVDHKLPASRGGTSDTNNLWALCRECNIGKSDYYADERSLVIEEGILNQRYGTERIAAYWTWLRKYRFNQKVDAYELRIIYGFQRQDLARAMYALRTQGRINFIYHSEDKTYTVK